MFQSRRAEHWAHRSVVFQSALMVSHKRRNRKEITSVWPWINSDFNQGDTCFTQTSSGAKTSFTLSLLEKFVALFGNLISTICRLHLSWVQLETPGSCAILRGVHLGPSHYFGEASSTPDGCRARRDEVLNYSAVLGIILQGLVMSILPGMKSHTPEPGYTSMYNEWGGGERGTDWGVISVPPRPPQPPTWLRVSADCGRI